jgi:hypothetical protein
VNPEPQRRRRDLGDRLEEEWGGIRPSCLSACLFAWVGRVGPWVGWVGVRWWEVGVGGGLSLQLQRESVLCLVRVTITIR